MVVRAVLFDLDDTLVSTDATNQAACSRAVELLHSRYPTVRGQDVAGSFWKAFIPQPWDPHNQIDVTEWRAQLWHRALQEQDIDDIALAREVQDCFDMTRMASFKWLPGVEQDLKFLFISLITYRTGTSMSDKSKWSGNYKTKELKHALLQMATQRSNEISWEQLKPQNYLMLFLLVEVYERICCLNMLYLSIRESERDTQANILLHFPEEAHEKPHPSIFLKACELVGSRPEESIMVGDNLKTDIQGARNANLLAAVWVNVHGIADIPEDVTARPSYTISNVIELPQVLSLIQ